MKQKASYRVALTVALLAVALASVSPAYADWRERYDDVYVVDAAAVKVIEIDGVELRGMRVGAGGRDIGPLHMEFFLQKAEGRGRKLSTLGYQMGLVLRATRHVDFGAHLNGLLQQCEGCPDGGTGGGASAGFDIGIWPTKRLQLVGFYETEKLREPSRRTVGIALRFGWKMK